MTISNATEKIALIPFTHRNSLFVVTQSTNLWLMTDIFLTREVGQCTISRLKAISFIDSKSQDKDCEHLTHGLSLAVHCYAGARDLYNRVTVFLIIESTNLWRMTVNDLTGEVGQCTISHLKVISFVDSKSQDKDCEPPHSRTIARCSLLHRVTVFLIIESTNIWRMTGNDLTGEVGQCTISRLKAISFIDKKSQDKDCEPPHSRAIARCSLLRRCGDLYNTVTVFLIFESTNLWRMTGNDLTGEVGQCTISHLKAISFIDSKSQDKDCEPPHSRTIALCSLLRRVTVFLIIESTNLWRMTGNDLTGEVGQCTISHLKVISFIDSKSQDKDCAGDLYNRVTVFLIIESTNLWRMTVNDLTGEVGQCTISRLKAISFIDSKTQDKDCAGDLYNTVTVFLIFESTNLWRMTGNDLTGEVGQCTISHLKIVSHLTHGLSFAVHCYAGAGDLYNRVTVFLIIESINLWRMTGNDLTGEVGQCTISHLKVISFVDSKSQDKDCAGDLYNGVIVFLIIESTNIWRMTGTDLTGEVGQCTISHLQAISFIDSKSQDKDCEPPHSRTI
ncbi:hypothetical protein J6590_046525, partial [Homalodisca vitripennis]